MTKIFFTSLLIVSSLHVWAQRSTRITGTFTQATFQDVVKVIESQTDFQLSYNSLWTDSLVVNHTANNEEVAAVLGKIFENTDLHFSVYHQQIYITKERQLLTQLPDDFFGQQERPATTAAPAFDYSDFEQREKKKKLAEERLYSIGPRTDNLQGKATIAGVVRDSKSGEPVIGASVYVENPMIGSSTDQFGHYSLTLSKGQHLVKVKSIGMKNTHRQVMLYANGRLDIEIQEDITPLKEVVVEADRDARVTGMQMGMEKLDIKTMKQMPLALGETDIMKVVLTLPGVQTVGEGTVGLNVRGGATNQNLILYNDAVVYNPSHMFGFFSTFNPDVLKNVELYKSGINAEYGGRLSSVLDVHTREGNLKKFSGSGGISPITGRLSLEGPIIKDRTSFLIGVRSTYSDWILDRVKSKELKNSDASFYDLNASISHKFNDNNNLYISGYMSQDKFRLNSDTSYQYSDRNASIKWKHVFSPKLYGVLTGTTSQYEYNLTSDANPVNAFAMDFRIRQLNAKADFNYFPHAKHIITAGASVTRYNISPGTFTPNGEASEITPLNIQHEQGVESAIYIGENFEITPKLSIYGGLRYSYYQNKGPRDVYTYGATRQESSIQDTVHYASGSIATYHGAEPRFSLRYLLTPTTSMKLSFNRMRQYIQMLSNTTAITPTDIWKLSDTYIKPQVGDQWSIGFYKNMKGNMIETSVEAYYKTMHDAMDYRNGAELLLNPHLETDVLQARGKAYGIEVMVKKSTGKINGWVSYTYSRSLLQTRGATAGETINNGNYYASSYDKPHAVNIIGNYKFSRRFNVSLNVVYSTGRPITIPIAKYDLDGVKRVYYSDRNAYRIPDYFRTDLSINVEGNHKVKKLAHSSWTFAVYNLTGRENAYSVYFLSQGGRIRGYKMSIFAQPIPTITYNFKF
jgi:hypothetical protein